MVTIYVKSAESSQLPYSSIEVPAGNSASREGELLVVVDEADDTVAEFDATLIIGWVATESE